MATEQISTSIIADDAVTGAKIENNPTVAGNLSVGGTAAVTGTSTFTGASTFSGGIANSGTITAGTIGSAVVFPSTSPYFTFFHDIQWESDYTGHTVFKTVGASVGPWQNKKASSQVFVELSIAYVINHNTSGGSQYARYGYGALFHHSSSIAKGTSATSGSDTSNLGTEIGVQIIGRNGNSTSTAAGHEYIHTIFSGDFTSGSAGTNYYFHFAGKLDYSMLRLRTWDNGSGNDYPVTLKVIEIP